MGIVLGLKSMLHSPTQKPRLFGEDQSSAWLGQMLSLVFFGKLLKFADFSRAHPGLFLKMMAPPPSRTTPTTVTPPTLTFLSGAQWHKRVILEAIKSILS